jgi:hypothetical protein
MAPLRGQASRRSPSQHGSIELHSSCEMTEIFWNIVNQQPMQQGGPSDENQANE